MKRRRQDPTEPRLLGAADHVGNHHPSPSAPDSKSAGGFGWYSPAQQQAHELSVVGAPAELGAAHGLSVVGPAPPVYKAAGGGWYPPPGATAATAAAAAAAGSRTVGGVGAR
jgi:hypothetical protein